MASSATVSSTCGRWCTPWTSTVCAIRSSSICGRGSGAERMVLYITAEDVFGDEATPSSGPRPLHTIPPTLSALYDMGMRHHVRDASLLWAATNELEPVPDWRLDRLVIRIALYGREKLKLEPGSRAAIFGPLGWI